MGSRDYRHREPKKPKKVARKISEISVLPSPTVVEVVGKRKKSQELPREEEKGEEGED